MMNYKDLIINIVNEFNTKRIGFGKTKLIKIAYLVELEYYRRNNERLTDAEWTYYKFGPYPFNYQDYLENKLIEFGDDNGSGFKPIHLKEFATLPSIPVNLKRMLSNIIENYGKKDLNDLLDYVYYDTEPMMNVNERGEKLDFTTVLSSEFYKVKSLKIDDSSKKEILKKFKVQAENALQL